MLNIEYVGHKPVISQTGISFQAKEDKYNFIEPATHVLHMCKELNEGFFTKRLSPKKELSHSDIFNILDQAIPNYEKTIKDQLVLYEEKLELEIAQAGDKVSLSPEEIKTYLNNLIFMKPYRLKRATNKLVYESIINSCVELIKEKNIQGVKVPFSISFLHVLTSLETTLAREKVRPHTSLNIRMHDQTPFAELTINFNV